ncbi:MAG: hypothetical protein GF350_13650 [Chitinivibrionales bacterium]|nr:hypothetical protein [Chitinivibrionales bacterium]
MKLIAPESRDIVSANIHKHNQGMDIPPYEYSLITKNRQKLVGIITSKLIIYGGRKSILGIITDITEQRKLERTLTEMEARQRERIGHDLHDGIGQYLTGVAFKCKALEQQLLAGTAVSVSDLAEIKDLVNQAAQQVNQLSKGLSPIDTQQEGLFAAIEELCDTTEKTFSIPCSIVYPPDLRINNSIIANHLYRIVQEGIINSVKHSGTHAIAVSFGLQNKNALLTIADNGIGITKKKKEPSGMGLRIMKYRAQLIGATLKISSSKNKGTTIECLFPIPKE